MRRLSENEIMQAGDVIRYIDDEDTLIIEGGLIGLRAKEVGGWGNESCVERPNENKPEPQPTTPQISYHGATTVVRWPDGEINSAKPCQAQPEKDIKADTFDPTIGFLHCLAKKHYGHEYKKFIENAVTQ